MDARDFHLEPDRQQSTPVYLQLYRRFRDAIAQGRLRPGDRVPAVRALASELNLARGTVESAYQMLIGEGYLQARGPAGTVVSPQLATHAYSAVASGPPSPAPAAAPSPLLTAAEPLPFQLGLPALDVFPRKLWTRLAAQRLRGLNPAGMNYPDNQGHLALRQALAAYLGISRGIGCSPEQIFITAGYRSTLNLIARSLMQPGDRCWFEDPGYFHARDALRAAGAELVPVAVDEEGLRVEDGLRQAADARFAVVTPSHQSPLGVSLSLARRLALLDWAKASGAWIIEDDYDSEYRYHGRPLPALKGLDRHGRVLYTGTFSKVLFPGLRLAYLVVPTSEIERFRRTADAFAQGSPELLQATVSDFLAQGHFARHLKKMRKLYAERRSALQQALQGRFGPRLQIDLQAGGIHILARLRNESGVDEDDVALAARANAQGLAVLPLSPWYLGASPAGRGLLMGFTNIAGAAQAQMLAERLHAAIA